MPNYKCCNKLIRSDSCTSCHLSSESRSPRVKSVAKSEGNPANIVMIDASEESMAVMFKGPKEVKDAIKKVLAETVGKREEKGKGDGPKREKNNSDEKTKRSAFVYGKLNKICRSPMACPLEGCTRIVAATSLLSHCLSDHPKEGREIPTKAIFGGQRCILIFNPYETCIGQSKFLACLLYGGKSEDRSDRPAACGLSLPNVFLFGRFTPYRDYLSIMVMETMCSFTQHLEAKKKSIPHKQRIAYDRWDTEYFNVIWLVSSDTVRPLHAVITVFDTNFNKAESRIINIHPLSANFDPRANLDCSEHCLKLASGTLRRLGQSPQAAMFIEVMIMDFDDQKEGQDDTIVE